MDIHKPKPMHNLREFLGEVLIIVIGVLIALLAEQVVSRWHWQESLHGALDEVAYDLDVERGQAIERLRAHQCVQSRLDFLSALVDRSDRSGYLETLGSIGTPPARVWSSAAWSSLVQNQLTEHIPTDTRASLGVLYSVVDDLKARNDEELQFWTKLYGLSGPGRTFDHNEANAFRTLISQARFADRYMSDLSAQFLRRIHESAEIKVDSHYTTYYEYRDLNKEAICGSIGPVPQNYGAAPWADFDSEISSWRQYLIRPNK